MGCMLHCDALGVHLYMWVVDTVFIVNSREHAFEFHGKNLCTSHCELTLNRVSMSPMT
jgi:hypothetical protein